MIVEFLIFLVTSIGFYLVYNHYKVVSYFRSKGVKCKSGIPLFGNILRSTFQRRHMVYDIRDVYRSFPEERYVGYIEGTSPIYLIRDPELIKRITVKDFDHFVDHRAFGYDDLFDQSLFTMKGEKWRDMRITLSPAFTGSKIRGMVPFILEISNNFIQHLKETEGDEIDLSYVVRAYTNDVIASIAFGLEVDSLKDPDNDFYKAGQSLMAFTPIQKFKMFLKMQFPIIEKTFKLGSIFPEKTTAFLRNIVVKTMNHRETNNLQRADMIQILMEAAKGTLKHSPKTDSDDSLGFATTEEHLVKSTDKVRKWTEVELVSQAFLFFIGGFDSSAVVLVLALHELALHEEVQDKLYQEIIKHKKVHKDLTYDEIPNLKYLDCVVNETLRRWAPGLFIDRVCVKPYELPPPREGGKPVLLGVGDVVYCPINTLQTDEQYYPDPDKFTPERFSDDNKDNINPCTFLPFGSGPRNCIASRFVLLELKIILYHIILNFKVLRCTKTSDPIKLLPSELTIRVKGGSWVKMETRS